MIAMVALTVIWSMCSSALSGDGRTDEDHEYCASHPDARPNERNFLLLLDHYRHLAIWLPHLNPAVFNPTLEKPDHSKGHKGVGYTIYEAGLKSNQQRCL